MLQEVKRDFGLIFSKSEQSLVNKLSDMFKIRLSIYKLESKKGHNTRSLSSCLRLSTDLKAVWET